MISKWIKFTFYFSLYVCITFIIGALPISLICRRKYASKFLSWISKKTLSVLGVYLELENKFNLSQSHLITCNHISYIDALIIQSVFPCVMITSKEIEATPVLGWIAKGAGSIFVERRNKTTIDIDNIEIQKTLEYGVSVVLFPEGTSSNGQNVLPFKSGLFDSVRFAQLQVLPLCLKYTQVDGKKYGPLNYDDVAYYSDMTFFKHLCRLMKRKKINVKLTVLEPIDAHPFENRKDLSIECYNRINTGFFQTNTRHFL